MAIHFFEAGKYENKDLPEEHFKAKSTWEYINALDSEKALKPVYPLYQKLCQIAHPSRDTAYLYFKNRKDIWSVEEIDEGEEIKRLEETYDTEYEETFQKCFNSALLSLWIIDQLPIKELKSAGVRRINFENIGEFQKIKKLISV